MDHGRPSGRSSGRRGWPGALWWRAPGTAVRAWGWGLLLVAGTALLAASLVAPPRFVRAAEDAALQQVRSAVEQDAFRGTAVDLRVSWEGALSPAGDERLDEVLEALPGHGSPVSTVFGDGPGSVAEPVLVAGDRVATATLWGRDGVLPLLEGAAGAGPTDTGEGGVWLPRAVAEDLGVEPGGSVGLGLRRYVDDRPEKVVEATVAGLFDPADDERLPADVMALGIDRLDLPGTLAVGEEPALVVAGQRTVERLLLRLDEAPNHVEDLALDAGLDPAQARAAVAAVQDTAVDLTVRGGLAGAFLEARPNAAEPLVSSDLADVVATAEDAAAASEVQVAPLARATLAGAVVLLAAGLLLWTRSRTLELRALADLGARAPGVAVLAVLEVLPVVLVAVPAGAALGWLAVDVAGPPGRQGGAGALAETVEAAVLGLALVCALAVLVRLGAWVVLEGSGTRAASITARRGWTAPQVAGLVVVAAAAVAVFSVQSLDLRSRATGPLAAVVPLAVVAAAAVVVVPLAGRLGRWLPTRARRGSPLWLGRTRVGGSVAVAVGMALALGVLGYGLAVREGIEVGTADKAAAEAGAQVRVDVGEQLNGSEFEEVDDRLGPGSTAVYRRSVSLPPDFGDQPLLAIDTRTFLGVAEWGESLAEEGVPALERLLGGAEPGDPVPVVLAGTTDRRVGEELVLRFSAGGDVFAEVAAVVEALPGSEGERGDLTVVADRERLGRWLPAPIDPRTPPEEVSGAGVFSAEVWSSLDAGATADLLRGAGLEPVEVVLLTEVAGEPSLLAAGWTVGYLLPLGLACLALLLALTALACRRVLDRDAVADVVLARFGWSARDRLVARTREVLGLLVVSALAAAAGVALLLVGPTLLETLPAVAPVTRPRVDPLGAVVWAAVLLSAALLAVVVLTAGAGRRPVQEVLRAPR